MVKKTGLKINLNNLVLSVHTIWVMFLGVVLLFWGCVIQRLVEY